jgi:hypothetical protein
MDFEIVFNKIIEDAKEQGMQIFFPRIVSVPKGSKQESEIDIFDHEYVNQQAGYYGDDFYGEIYYPIGDGKYLEVGFSI